MMLHWLKQKWQCTLQGWVGWVGWVRAHAGVGVCVLMRVYVCTLMCERAHAGVRVVRVRAHACARSCVCVLMRVHSCMHA